MLEMVCVVGCEMLCLMWLWYEYRLIKDIKIDRTSRGRSKICFLHVVRRKGINGMEVFVR